jgi:tetratricopeptide (TPR) repeat protein
MRARLVLAAVALACGCLAAPPRALAQTEPGSISICDDPAYRGGADYNYYCSGNAGQGSTPRDLPPDYDPNRYYGMLHSTPQAILRHLFGSHPDARHQRAHDLNERGANAYSAGDYVTAEHFFSLAARDWPDDPSIAQNLRNTRHQLALRFNEQGAQAYNAGDYAAAEHLFALAVQDWPDDPVIARNLSAARQHQAAPQQQPAALGRSFTVYPAVRGEASIVRQDGSQVALQNQHPIALQSGDRIVLTAGEDSRVQLLLPDQTILTIGGVTGGAGFTIDNFAYTPDGSTDEFEATLSLGRLRFVTAPLPPHRAEDLRVKLAVGTIGVRGTDIEVMVDAHGDGHIKLYSGSADYAVAGSVLTLQPGQAVDLVGYLAAGPRPIAEWTPRTQSAIAEPSQGSRGSAQARLVQALEGSWFLNCANERSDIFHVDGERLLLTRHSGQGVRDYDRNLRILSNDGSVLTAASADDASDDFAFRISGETMIDGDGRHWVRCP